MNLDQLKAAARQVPFRDPPPPVVQALRAALVEAARGAPPVRPRLRRPAVAGAALAVVLGAAAALALWLATGDGAGGVIGPPVPEQAGPPRAQIDATPGAVFQREPRGRAGDGRVGDDGVRVREGEIAIRLDQWPDGERFRIRAGDAEIEIIPVSGAASVRVAVADGRLSEVRLESGQAELHRPGLPPVPLGPGIALLAPPPAEEPCAGCADDRPPGRRRARDDEPSSARAVALRNNGGDACMTCLLGEDPESCKRQVCSIGSCPDACSACLLALHNLEVCADVCPQDGSCAWPTFDGDHACWADRSCGSLVDDAYCSPTDEGGTECVHPCADCVALEGGDAEAERRCGCEPGSFTGNPGWDCLRENDSDWTQCEDELCPGTFFGPDFTCVQSTGGGPCGTCVRNADTWSECVDSCCTPPEDNPAWIGPSFCRQLPPDPRDLQPL